MALPPLWPVAQALLALIEDTFAAEGVDLPGRRYITAGAASSIAWDCEQLVIGLQQMSPMPAGDAAGAEYAAATPAPPSLILPPSAAFIAELTRLQPEPTSAPRGSGNPTPPTVEQEMCAAQKSLTDAAALHRCGARAMRLGLAEGGTVSSAGVEPVGPDGGMSAQRLRITVTLLA